MNSGQLIAMIVFVLTNFGTLYLITNKFEQNWLSKLLHGKNTNLIPKKIRGNNEFSLWAWRFFLIAEAFVLLIVLKVIL